MLYRIAINLTTPQSCTLVISSSSFNVTFREMLGNCIRVKSVRPVSHTIAISSSVIQETVSIIDFIIVIYIDIKCKYRTRECVTCFFIKFIYCKLDRNESDILNCDCYRSIISTIRKRNCFRIRIEIISVRCLCLNN